MTQPGSVQPRKRPAQARSQETVRAVLDAAKAILEERGLEGRTTNRVAQHARLSVGSLYQYFPNKEAIVLALLEQHLHEAEALRPSGLDRSALSLAARIESVVRWFLATHAASPDLHRALTLAAPSILGAERVRRLERMFQRRVVEALRPHAAEIVRDDLELAAFIVAQSLEALTHSAVLHHPELLVGGRLATEITELLFGYLTGRRAE